MVQDSPNTSFEKRKLDPNYLRSKSALNVAGKDRYSDFDFLNDQSPSHTPNQKNAKEIEDDLNNQQKNELVASESPFSSPMLRNKENSLIPQF